MLVLVDTEKKAMKKVDDVGATGEVVRDNIRRLREKRNLTYAELSRRLSEAGRPIPTLGLRRIEAGARRVDVDDLMALAVALDVTPNILLLPIGKEEDSVQLTGAGEMSVQTAWAWAHAEKSRTGLNPLHLFPNLPSWRRTVPISANDKEGDIRSYRVPEEDFRKVFESYEKRIRVLEERIGSDGDD